VPPPTIQPQSPSGPPPPPPRPAPCARSRTERSGKLTYAAVVEDAWGRWAGAAVRFSVVVGSAGFLVLYLVVVADLLVGERLAAGQRRSGSAGACQLVAQGAGLGGRGACGEPCCASFPDWHAAVQHAGSAEFTGVIPDLWPSLPDPLPWYLRRTAVLTWVALLVAPALSAWSLLAGAVTGSWRLPAAAAGLRCS
jgi:hypothetical protein